ncbi:hypothetical protein LIER_41414 [Lithospermum erythrorhizon]|uniref:Gag-pol polyprotein n=1 Tax=Lithospermum erythrorhizon TaxID=34254 RepID=A0AAV3RCX9_LITER
MINEKLVRKILRTLPKKFAHKVPTIEEAHDLTTMTVEQTHGARTTCCDNRHDDNKDEGEMTEEELLEDYKLLYTKWIELTMIYTKVATEKGKLKKENEKLTQMVLDRYDEIKNLNAHLKALNKGLKMMNSSTNILDEIPVIRKYAGDWL